MKCVRMRRWNYLAIEVMIVFGLLAACGPKAELSSLNASPGFDLSKYDISTFLPHLLASDVALEFGDFREEAEFTTATSGIVNSRFSLRSTSVVFVSERVPSAVAADLRSASSQTVYEPRAFDRAGVRRDRFPSVLNGTAVPSLDGGRLIALLGWRPGSEQAVEGSTDWVLKAVVVVDDQGQVTFPGLVQPQVENQWALLVSHFVPDSYASETELLMRIIAETGGETKVAEQGTIAWELDLLMEGSTEAERWWSIESELRPLDPELTPKEVLAGLRRHSVVVISAFQGEPGKDLVLVIGSREGRSLQSFLDYSRQASIYVDREATLEFTVSKIDRRTMEIEKSEVGSRISPGDLARSDYLVIRVASDRTVDVAAVSLDVFLRALDELGTSESINGSESSVDSGN